MIEVIKKIVANMLENSKLSKLEFGTVENVSPLKIRIDQKKVINEIVSTELGIQLIVTLVLEVMLFQ